MMRTLTRIYSLGIFFWVGLLPLIQAQDVTIEKNYDRSFLLLRGDQIEVKNKYGEIIVNTWYRDSVRFKVVLKAQGKNQAAVNKMMNRIDINMRKIGGLASAVTDVERRGGGFLGDLVDDLEGYSKSAFGGNKFTVNYEIWVPEDVDMELENRFGNVYLSNLLGNVDIEVAHGDIRGNRIEKSLDLKHSFGKSTFEYINDGTFKLRGVELEIDEAQKLTFESSSSEIQLESCKNLQFDSRNDKFYIEFLENVQGQGSFTDFTVDRLAQAARLDFSYGDIYLRRIDQNFGRVDLNGKSTDINVVLDQASYFRTTIEGPEERMILPNSMLTLQREELEDKSILLNGYVGNTNSDVGEFNVAARGGKLIVAIEETPIFTKQD